MLEVGAARQWKGLDEERPWIGALGDELGCEANWQISVSFAVTQVRLQASAKTKTAGLTYFLGKSRTCPVDAEISGRDDKGLPITCSLMT